MGDLNVSRDDFLHYSNGERWVMLPGPSPWVETWFYHALICYFISCRCCSISTSLALLATDYYSGDLLGIESLLEWGVDDLFHSHIGLHKRLYLVHLFGYDSGGGTWDATGGGCSYGGEMGGCSRNYCRGGVGDASCGAVVFYYIPWTVFAKSWTRWTKSLN